MRLARIDRPAGPCYGIVRDETVALLDRAPFGGRAVETGEQLLLHEVSLLAPVEPSAIMAIGRNYADHAKEMGFDLVAEPSVFMKPVASLLAPGGAVVLPPPELSQQVQHEVELAVVIGAPTRNVSRERAIDHVFGYTIANDVSARDLQRADTHVIRAKGFDTFCPIGPWIETDLDPSALSIRCAVNGQLRQDGNTADLMFDVATVIASISRWTTLLPGDVILTGSPSGTSTLQDGDEVELSIASIGTLVHTVTAA